MATTVLTNYVERDIIFFEKKAGRIPVKDFLDQNLSAYKKIV